MALKLRLSNLLVLLPCWFLTISLQAQFNPATNTCGPSRNRTGIATYPPKANSDRSSGISCTDNTFWAVWQDTLGGGDSYISQYEISNGVVTDLGIYDTTIVISLAFCNNLNGGTYSPTLYGSTESDPSPYYYSGSGWDSCEGSSPIYLYNAGGYGNYLYFLGGSANNNTIVRYTDSIFTPIYTSNFIMGATIAVDDSGDVWFMERDSLVNVVSHIKVISSSGQMLKVYNVDTFSASNLYGSFIMGDILYIGSGNQGALYPNSLLPFSFSGDTGILGNPISMPYNPGFADIASCGAGNPLTSHPSSVNDLPGNSGFIISPNPAGRDMVSISVDQNLIDKTAVVTDITGRDVSQIRLDGQKTMLDISNFADGIYLIAIHTADGESLTRKLIISR